MVGPPSLQERALSSYLHPAGLAGSSSHGRRKVVSSALALGVAGLRFGSRHSGRSPSYTTCWLCGFEQMCPSLNPLCGLWVYLPLSSCEGDTVLSQLRCEKSLASRLGGQVLE